MHMVPKIVQPIEDQDSYESRKFVSSLLLLLTAIVNMCVCVPLQTVERGNEMSEDKQRRRSYYT